MSTSVQSSSQQAHAPTSRTSARSRVALRVTQVMVSALSLLLTVTAVGCVGQEERPDGLSVEIQPGYAALAPDARKVYPEGPYGSNNPEVGAVIEDLALEGYVQKDGPGLPTDGEYQSLRLQDLRETDASFLIVHVSAAWCGTCQVGAFDLSQYSSAIREAGGIPLELVVDGRASGIDPEPELLAAWVDLAELNMTTVGPGEERVRKVFPDRDYVYIVDLTTMEVVWRKSVPGLDPSSGEVGAAEILGTWLPN